MWETPQAKQTTEGSVSALRQSMVEAPREVFVSGNCGKNQNKDGERTFHHFSSVPQSFSFCF